MPGSASPGPVMRTSNFHVLLGPTPNFRMGIWASGKFSVTQGSSSETRLSISRNCFTLMMSCP